MQKIRIFAPPGRSGRLGEDGPRFGENLAFGLQVSGHVFVRGSDAGVSQPMGHGAQIDAGTQQVDCGAVTHAVRMDAFALE